MVPPTASGDTPSSWRRETKSGRGRIGERRLILLGRVEQEGAILGGDKVEQVEFGKYALQVGKIPAGEKDQLAA
jgi:hypothetical protein